MYHYILVNLLLKNDPSMFNGILYHIVEIIIKNIYQANNRIFCLLVFGDMSCTPWTLNLLANINSNCIPDRSPHIVLLHFFFASHAYAHNSATKCRRKSPFWIVPRVTLMRTYFLFFNLWSREGLLIYLLKVCRDS